MGAQGYTVSTSSIFCVSCLDTNPFTLGFASVFLMLNLGGQFRTETLLRPGPKARIGCWRAFQHSVIGPAAVGTKIFAEGFQRGPGIGSRVPFGLFFWILFLQGQEKYRLRPRPWAEIALKDP